MSNQLATLGVPVCATALVLLVGWRLLGKKKLPLPPGPKGYPVVGNLFDMPKENDSPVYSEWQKTYGDMIHISVLGKHFLIISSLKVAADLLQKRSTYYSGRMRFIFGGELCHHNHSMVLQEGAYHREMRKCGHRALNSTAVKQWQWLEEEAAHETLRRLLQNPTDFVKHFHRNAAFSIMRIAYGYQLKREDDPLLRNANKVLDNFSKACAPGRWLVDVIPFLRYVPEWVPGAGFKKTARIWAHEREQLYNVPFDFVKKGMVAGTALPSMTALLLDTKKPHTNEEHIKDAIGSLYAGGTDTTPSALTSFVLAMTLYPHVQRKARAELDQLLRWGPVVAMGVPHRLIKEDEYKGYRIPKNTIVLTNIWHMNRDSSAYGPDVDDFRPERFLGPDPTPWGFSTSNTQEFGSPAFGFGRRVCPGEHLADSSLYIVCSSMLATMDISPVSGPDGTPAMPEIQYTSGVVIHPKAFQCNIKARSAKAAELINGTAL
ncbi:cytochrome P450 [Calocera viscosa TUFC12733]|uniref:Cytochrome P450 n=1 Tax=Calocera viscosa (strain TUFC12733) TaxID=1330018 RepID=A0A167KT01_CALVF|nr:cytochrome P450 [Calocera viscosa TUFC12733]